MSPQALAMAEELDLSRIFDRDSLITDLREGVVSNQANGRLCLLSTDLLQGVYEAIFDEAGPAWGLMFKNCGRVWGTRVARRLDEESKLLLGKPFSELQVDEFLHFISGYFVFHGWGIVELDLTHAEERGVVEATLQNSIFAEVIEEPEEGAFVDSMIAGILAALMSHVAGQDLDCLQTECSSQDSELSRFIISGSERVEDAEERLESGESHQQILERI